MLLANNVPILLDYNYLQKPDYYNAYMIDTSRTINSI